MKKKRPKKRKVKKMQEKKPKKRGNREEIASEMAVDTKEIAV
ncbi:hypothetical protein [Acutalibacter muris]|nr:hypothetical protein [Acutalibacter muris]